MSHVADTIFLLGACREERMQFRLEAINGWLAENHRQSIVSVKDEALPRKWYGGSKALQSGVAIGAINYLDIEEFLAFARGLDWDADEDYSAQVLIKDEHDDKFTLHTIFEVKE